MSPETQDDVLERIADAFATAIRDGTEPRVADYVSRHPDMADELRPLLRSVESLESMKIEQQRSTSTLKY